MRNRRAARALGPMLTALVMVLSFGLIMAAQQPLPDAPQPQNSTPSLPEAPSATRPPQPPDTPPPALSGKPASGPPAAETSAPNPDAAPAGPPPQHGIATVPAGSAPPMMTGSARNELRPDIVQHVNFVLVPVTVKDNNGHLVEGLLRSDFSVFEDGVAQKIDFFTSDPFPLSAAVVLDTALPQNQWTKVRDTLSALVGAFSQYDEVAIFTYGNTVQKVQDFTGVNAATLTQSLRRVRGNTGKQGGVPVVTGPMTGSPTPTVNGHPMDQSVSPVPVMPKESYVLNDAILMAAQELAKREAANRARGIPPMRKVLFVVSDGHEVGSANSYADVLKVLLTRQIQVFAVGVDTGIPGYRQAQRVHIPGLGNGDILPKYASATGGQVYNEVTSHAIEDAYTRVTEEARNQYTIGYTTRASPSTSYRGIDVRVKRPNLRVFARDGYYPIPPER